MTSRETLIDLLRRAAIPAACLAFIAYFGFHAMAGNSGLLAWREYRAEHAVLTAQAEKVAAQRTALERQNALLDPRHVDPDLADELVRENLGVVRPDEVVVDLPPAR